MTYIERNYEEFESSMQEWVDQHPSKRSTIIFWGGMSYSPLRIMREVRQKTPLAKGLYTFLNESGKKFDTDPLDYISRMTMQKERN